MPDARMNARLLVLLPVLVAAIVAACASQEAGSGGAATAPEADSGTTTTELLDFEAEAEDFVHLQDMTQVRNLFIDNRLGFLDEALAVANNPDGGVYPVGTIIQLIPQEAMVKRGTGFSPFGDWEFFELDVSPEGTTIVNRGGAEIVNRFGLASCADCHGMALPQFDFVCEKTNGCEPLPIADEVFLALQATDPRPRAGGD